MKWIVLTGESGGLGQAILRAILRMEGYGVIGISRSFSEELQEIYDRNTGRYVHIPFDLSKPEGIKTLYLEEIRKIGPVYGYINNAAAVYDDLVTNASLDRINHLFKVNVYSPILLSKYCIRDMLLHETEGSLVHITSVSSRTGYRGLSMYAASKGALEAFSRTVAREWGSRGIRSNCVSPGFLETEMSSTLSADQKEKIYRRTALNKPTSIDSVAEAVCFLLTEKAASITGTILEVDNGTI